MKSWTEMPHFLFKIAQKVLFLEVEMVLQNCVILLLPPSAIGECWLDTKVEASFNWLKVWDIQVWNIQMWNIQMWNSVEGNCGWAASHSWSVMLRVRVDKKRERSNNLNSETFPYAISHCRGKTVSEDYFLFDCFKKETIGVRCSKSIRLFSCGRGSCSGNEIYLSIHEYFQFNK